MANRRMFSKAIIGSARFMRMPASARLLYYDLGMYADDDGIVEAFPVMRMTGAAEDDLRILTARDFVRVLNEDMVSVITDWTVNNQIRKDRYVQSIYHSLLTDNQLATKRQPNGNQTETQYSIGKESIGEYRAVEGSTPPPPIKDSFSAFLEEFPPDVVEWSKNEAKEHGQENNRKYIRSILQRIRDQGLQTLPDVLKAEEQRKRVVIPINNHGYQTHDYTAEDFDESFYVNFRKP